MKLSFLLAGTNHFIHAACTLRDAKIVFPFHYVELQEVCPLSISLLDDFPTHSHFSLCFLLLPMETQWTAAKMYQNAEKRLEMDYKLSLNVVSFLISCFFIATALFSCRRRQEILLIGVGVWGENKINFRYRMIVSETTSSDIGVGNG